MASQQFFNKFIIKEVMIMHEMAAKTKFTGRIGIITKNIRAELGIMSCDLRIGQKVYECTLPKSLVTEPKLVKKQKKFWSKNIAIMVQGPDSQPIYTIPANTVKWDQ